MLLWLASAEGTRDGTRRWGYPSWWTDLLSLSLVSQLVQYSGWTWWTRSQGVVQLVWAGVTDSAIEKIGGCGRGSVVAGEEFYRLSQIISSSICGWALWCFVVAPTSSAWNTRAAATVVETLIHIRGALPHREGCSICLLFGLCDITRACRIHFIMLGPI